ncbi:S-layer homology domain-containing protein [Pelotomaculum sp. FP]|uniref:S-layer homology domain-containing protein n=1 Tax=Pelotomaculum sp. FP TaxID=261474 RepID=UPI001864409B|nr:S-layer homology domain-containing protein [Pelotomaculum sp. FP]
MSNTSTDISLLLNKTTAAVGETVTASGTTAPNAWVPLKVVDASQSIVVFDATKADASGNYSIDFVVPADAPGTLIVITGEGSNVDTKSVTVTGMPPVDTEAPVWEGGNLTASNVGQTTLTLSWSGASDNVGVTGYKVFQDGALLTETPVTGTSYEVTGLSAGTEYPFKVEAVDAAGNESADGPSVTVTTESAPEEDTTAPSWDNGNLEAIDVSQISLTLSWSGASDNVGVTGYKVYQGDPLLTTTLVTGDSYTVTGLNPGTEYTFTVQAVDAAGNESADGPSTTVTTSNAVPITEQNVTITSDGANKNLAVTADTPSEVTITVPASVDDATVSVAALLNAPASGTVTTTALPALTIAANTSVGTDPIQVDIPAGTAVSAPEEWDGIVHLPTVQPNDSVAVTPESGNTATVNCVIEIGYGDVPLSFSKAVRILIPGQAGKDVGYSRGGVFTKITNIMSADSQEAADDELPTNGDGRIDVGNDLVIWTKHFTKFATYTQTPVESDTTAPSWGSGSSLTASDVGRTGLTLSWSGATDNVGVTGYNVYQGDSLLTTTPVTGNSYDVSGLSAGTEYTFTVQAVDAAGNESTDGPSVTVKTTSSGGGGGGGSGSSAPQAVSSTTGTAMVAPSAGGTIGLGSEAVVIIPANALQGTSKVEVKVQKADQVPETPEGFKLAGSVYEFSVDGKNSYNFNKDVVITLSFDPSALAPGEKPEIFYYDEASGQWVSLGGTVSGNTVTVQVDHFTKFAVMIAGEAEAVPSGQVPAALKDITGHWAMDSINQLVALGAISGYPDGTFKPDNSITRAEFAAVLVKAFKLENKGGGVFADTTAHWARDYIAAAADNGVVNGYDTGAFGPDDLITREQMAVMIVKAAKLTPVAGETQFADNGSISGWAGNAVVTATRNGIMKGYPDNTFQPHSQATRAEAVTVIVNALKLSS